MQNDIQILGAVSQSAEEMVLKTIKCEFEAHQPHHFSFSTILLIFKKISITTSGCWVIKSQRHRPRIKINKRLYQVAAVLLECFTGEYFNFPTREVCHTCTNIRCVNPKHTYWGTRSQNTLDSVRAGTHVNTRKTHCPRGHKYDIKDEKGYRTCSKCIGAKNILGRL